MANKNLIETGALPEQFRTLPITLKRIDQTEEQRAAGEPATYEVAVSTESEVERWYGIEVLDHSKGSIDMTRLKRGAAVLVDHRGDQVGVVESARLDDDKVLRATVKFSRSARGQEVERDVADGIRQNISVGYFVKKAKLVETRDGGVEVWRITRWQPAEVSIVSVPADVMAGVGRNYGSGEVKESPVELEREVPKMKKVRGDNGTIIEVADSDPRPEAHEAAPTPQPPQVGADAEEKRANAIREMCRTAGMQDRAQEFILSPLTAEAIAARIALARATVGSAQPAAEKVVNDMSRKERGMYSYRAAIRAAVEGRSDGLEGAVNRALADAWPKGVERKGNFIIPLDMRTDEERLEAYAMRTMTSLDTGKGTETVFQQYGQLIDLLRNRSILMTAGAQVLTGLTGPIAFPRLTAGATVEFAPEYRGTTNPTTPSDLGFGMEHLVPKTMRGLMLYTRQLLQQTSIDLEARARNELAIAHGLAWDRSGLHGSGANGQPAGIYKAIGIGDKDFSSVAPTIASLMDMVTTIAGQNADVQTMRYITTPFMAGKLRVTQEFTTPGSTRTIWQGNIRDGDILGYPAHSTNQCSKVMGGANGVEDTGGNFHALVFGNWTDLIIGMFGALELLPDPYTGAADQLVKIHTFQMGDLLFQRGESFVRGRNAVIT